MTTEVSRRRALTYLRILAFTLLFFNGAGALYGGASLMFHPDGSGLRLNPALLLHTPFHDYMIPGFVLFTVNGLFSITALLLGATGYRGYDRYITAQGVLLLGWLAVQILLIRTLDIMHLVMGITGVGLVACGIAIKQLNETLEMN